MSHKQTVELHKESHVPSLPRAAHSSGHGVGGGEGGGDDGRGGACGQWRNRPDCCQGETSLGQLSLGEPTSQCSYLGKPQVTRRRPERGAQQAC